MTTYYVATIARYVLVEAADEAEARRLAPAALLALDPERTAPIQIHTVRLATPDEIQLQRWHNEALAENATPE
jgi:hypothetical protein